jgi:hypothetical protein
MKKLIVMILLLCIPSISHASDLTSLNAVNLVKASCTSSDGIIKVGLIYTNRETDELVFWKGGTVSCQYEVCLNTGNLLNPQKGTVISRGNAMLKEFSQDFYIDIPKQHLNQDKWGIITCTTRIGGRIYTSTDNVNLK